METTNNTFKQELKELLEKYEAEITVYTDYDYNGCSVKSIDIDFKEDSKYQNISVLGETLQSKDI